MDTKKALIGAGVLAAIGTSAGLYFGADEKLELAEIKPTGLSIETSIKVDGKTPTAAEYNNERSKMAGKVKNGQFSGTWRDLVEYIELVNEDAEARKQPVISGSYDKPLFEKTNENLKQITIKEITSK